MDEFAAPMGMENHAAPPEGEVIQGTAMDIDDDKSNAKLIPEEWKGQKLKIIFKRELVFGRLFRLLWFARWIQLRRRNK